MIGGNITAALQVKTGETENAIGEAVTEWRTAKMLFGFLDYATGETKHTNFSVKLEETTHIFICDFEPLDDDITAEKARMLINGLIYDVSFIDNPMGLNKHLEFYLKFKGAQSHG